MMIPEKNFAEKIKALLNGVKQSGLRSVYTLEELKHPNKALLSAGLMITMENGDLWRLDVVPLEVKETK